MELKRAKEVLDGMCDIFGRDRIVAYDELGAISVSAYAGSGSVVMKDKFKLAQLEAIATWMRDPEGVTKA